MTPTGALAMDLQEAIYRRRAVRAVLDVVVIQTVMHLLRHDVADNAVRDGVALGDHAHDDVAVGDDASQMVALDDGQDAMPLLRMVAAALLTLVDTEAAAMLRLMISRACMAISQSFRLRTPGRSPRAISSVRARAALPVVDPPQSAVRPTFRAPPVPADAAQDRMAGQILARALRPISKATCWKPTPISPA